MAAPAGFRFVLWAKLAALFRQGAGFFESKSRHDDFESPMSAGRLKGAPPHWLAMVQKRTPGFLHQLESGAGQTTLLTDATTRQREQEKSQASFNRTIEPSVSEPVLPAKNPTIRVKPRPVEKSEGDESREVFGSGDAKDKPRIQKADAAPLRNKANESRQTADFETAQRTDETRRTHYQTALRFKSKKPASSFKVTQQTQNERPDIFNLQPVVFTKKDDAVNQSISEQVQMTEARTMKKVLPIKDSPSKETLKISFHHDEQRPSQTRPGNPEGAIHESVHSDQSAYSSTQRIPSTKVHPTPCQASVSDCQNVSANDYWAELSGLKKMPLHRGLWPELPEDAWSELWRNLAEPAGTEHEVKHADSRESSWNG